jgi:hypothetical protein
MEGIESQTTDKRQSFMLLTVDMCYTGGGDVDRLTWEPYRMLERKFIFD